MGLDLKRLQMCVLFFLCGWGALSQGAKAPRTCVRIGVCTILETAKHSMAESHILEEMAEAATKNQGSNKAIKGIKGLKVKDIQQPNVTINYIPNMGLSIELWSQITIAGKSFIGGSMEITVASKMITSCKMSIVDKELIFVVTRCQVELISCKTNLPSSMLPKIVNKFLNSTLAKVMPGMMCPAAHKVVAEMKEQIKAMWVPRPIGDIGSIKYVLDGSPIITSTHASVCFETQITEADGGKIEIPSEPPAVDASPELLANRSDLTMPVNILNAAMKLNDVLVREVSGEMVNRDALLEKVPSMEIPEADLAFEIRSSDTPSWSLEPGVATLSVHLTIVLKTRPEGENLFSIAADLKIISTFQVKNGVLHMSLGEDRLENLALESSAVGEFDPELLNSYLHVTLSATLKTDLEKSMENGVPLPSLMGADYGEATPEVLQDTLQVLVNSECE